MITDLISSIHWLIGSYKTLAPSKHFVISFFHFERLEEKKSFQTLFAGITTLSQGIFYLGRERKIHVES